MTSTLIEGEKEVILVNAQFSKSEALRVAADILDSGKTLKTILSVMVIQTFISVWMYLSSIFQMPKSSQRQKQ